jgi:hypothetical protein
MDMGNLVALTGAEARHRMAGKGSAIASMAA